jgi:anti-sigma factor RsiW
VIAQIQAYVDGELPAVECSGIEQHCATCEPCAALVQGLRQTIGVCREAGRAPLPESVRARAREQVKRLLTERKTSG